MGAMVVGCFRHFISKRVILGYNSLRQVTGWPDNDWRSNSLSDVHRSGKHRPGTVHCGATVRCYFGGDISRALRAVKMVVK